MFSTHEPDTFHLNYKQKLDKIVKNCIQKDNKQSK